MQELNVMLNFTVFAISVSIELLSCITVESKNHSQCIILTYPCAPSLRHMMVQKFIMTTCCTRQLIMITYDKLQSWPEIQWTAVTPVIVSQNSLWHLSQPFINFYGQGNGSYLCYWWNNSRFQICLLLYIFFLLNSFLNYHWFSTSNGRPWTMSYIFLETMMAN